MQVWTSVEEECKVHLERRTDFQRNRPPERVFEHLVTEAARETNDDHGFIYNTLFFGHEQYRRDIFIVVFVRREVELGNDRKCE